MNRSVPGVLFTAVNHDSDGTRVGEFDVHVLLEAAGTDGQTGLPGKPDAVVEEAFRLTGRGGFGEVRATAAAGISEEGELADEEEAPAYVKRREVELAFGVSEDAEVDDLLHDVIGVTLGVTAGDADEHDQPGTDASRFPAIDEDAGPADALHEGFHAEVLLASEEPDDEEPASDDFDEEPEPELADVEASL